jgi:hypothetical protein
MNPKLRDLLFFQLLAKSLIAKSWEMNPGAYRSATQRQAQKAATALKK